MQREARLQALAQEAATLTPGGVVEGSGGPVSGSPMPAALAPAAAGYYDLPVLKAPVWTWEVPLYFFVGGTAGGASVLAAAYGWFSDNRPLARHARWIAFGGAALSPVLLIRDLGRPDRFLNMMRVFKWRSPMSVGSWVLAGFGMHTAISAFGHELLEHMQTHPAYPRGRIYSNRVDSDMATADQMLLFRNSDAARARKRLAWVSRKGPQREEFRRAILARTAERANHPERLPAVRLGTLFVAKSTLTAALCGSVLATYTGVLLGATANPVWNHHHTLLPVHFGTAGMGSAVATLEQLGHDDPGLQALGIATAAIETVLGAVAESDHSIVSEPLRTGRSGKMIRAGALLCGPVALGLRLLGARSENARRLAGIAFVSGALLSRFGWIEAGKASARDSRAVLEAES